MFKIELISPPTPGVRNPSMIAAASGAFRERERSRIRDQREKRKVETDGGNYVIPEKRKESPQGDAAACVKRAQERALPNRPAMRLTPLVNLKRAFRGPYKPIVRWDAATIQTLADLGIPTCRVLRHQGRCRFISRNGNLMRRFDELAGQVAGLLDVDDAVIDDRRNGSVAIVPLNALRRVGKMNKYLLVGMLVKEKFVIVTPHAQLLQKLR